MASTLKVQNIAHTDGTTAMTIASTGVVSPKTTSFVSVYPKGTTGYQTVSANNYLPFNTIYESHGTGASDFSTTNYVYTAPVNGLYHLSVKSQSGAENDVKNWLLRVDTTLLWYAFWSADERTWGGTILKKLNAGQTIGVYSNGDSKYYQHADSLPSLNHYTTMQIMLLQEI